MAGLLCAGLIGVGVFFAFKDPKQAAKSTELMGQEIPILGQQHIAIGASHVAYNSNPPTSGPHYATPAAAGAYSEALPDEQVVHNLEHGYVWISYNPDKVGKDVPAKLAEAIDSYAKTILTPRPADDSAIALASWGRLLKLDVYDEGQVINFIKANRFKAPEPNGP